MFNGLRRIASSLMPLHLDPVHVQEVEIVIIPLVLVISCLQRKLSPPYLESQPLSIVTMLSEIVFKKILYAF